MNTSEQIKALLAETTKLAEEATEGPWEFREEEITRGGKRGKSMPFALCGPRDTRYVVSPDWCDDKEGGVWQAWLSVEPKNRAFIAAARTALPARDAALLVALDGYAHIRAANLMNNFSTAIEDSTIAAILSILKESAK